MEIRKLNANDFDQLLNTLNRVFTIENKKQMDFLTLMPKMWIKDDAHMQKHIGVFDGDNLCAVVGTYIYELKICGQTIKCATIGNVATLPEYEGKGYFTKLMSMAVEEADKIGLDFTRLAGKRQRYARFGYENGGVIYRFTFTESNRKYCFDQNSFKDITFKKVESNDQDLIAYIRNLSNSKDVCYYRSEQQPLSQVYLGLISRNNQPFVAFDGQNPVGYVCANLKGDVLDEVRAKDFDAYKQIICAWQLVTGLNISVPVAPYNVQELKLMSSICDKLNVNFPSKFRINNWEKMFDVFMKLKHKTYAMPQGEFVLEIIGFGSFKFYVNESGAGCVKTQQMPQLSLDRIRATAFVFGPLPAQITASCADIASLWFPLPISWDFVESI